MKMKLNMHYKQAKSPVGQALQQQFEALVAFAIKNDFKTFAILSEEEQYPELGEQFRELCFRLLEQLEQAETAFLEDQLEKGHKIAYCAQFISCGWFFVWDQKSDVTECPHCSLKRGERCFDCATPEHQKVILKLKQLREDSSKL